jgi:hypothetical protein
MIALVVWRAAPPSSGGTATGPDGLTGSDPVPDSEKPTLAIPPAVPNTAPAFSSGDTTLRLRITGVPEYLLPAEVARLQASLSRGRDRITPSKPLRWTSSNRRVVSANERSGDVTAASPGEARIRVSDGAATKEVTVRVVAPAITSLTLDGPVRLTVGETRTIRAAALDQRGRPISTERVTWQVLDAAVGAVDSGGSVRGVATGTLRVAATAGKASAEHLIQVVSRPAGPLVATPLAVTPQLMMDSGKVVARPNEQPEAARPALSDADVAAMVASVANLFFSRDSSALRSLYYAQGATEEANRVFLMQVVAQSSAIGVRNARPSPENRYAGEGNARALLELEWRDNLVRRTASLELLLSIAMDEGTITLRGFRVVNTTRL